MACILKPECKFLSRYFRCLLPEETVDGRSQGKHDARDSHIQEGQNITDHKVQSLEHKALPLPLPHLKDKDVSKIRG